MAQNILLIGIDAECALDDINITRSNTADDYVPGRYDAVCARDIGDISLIRARDALIPIFFIPDEYCPDAALCAFNAGASDAIPPPYEKTLAARVRSVPGEALEHMRALVDDINCSVCAVMVRDDFSLDYVLANDQHFERLGYTRERFFAEIADPFSIVHPEDRERVKAAIVEVLETGADMTYDYRIMKADGEYAHMRCNASRASIVGVGERLLFSVTTDITERLRIERTAALAAEQMQAIIDNVNGGVTATIIDGENSRFLFANDHYFEQLGYTRAQYFAEVTNVFSLVHPDDVARVIEQTERASELRRSFSIDYRVIRRDGELRNMRSNVAITDFPGISKPVQLAVANDITDIAAAEREIKRASERLHAIVSNIASGVTAVKVGDDGKVSPLFFTDKYYELLGYTKDQYLAEVTDEFSPIHPDDISWVMPKVFAVNREDKSVTLEFRAIRRDGREIWLRDVITPIRFADTDGIVQLSVFTDITESRNLADQLQILTQNIPGGLAMFELTPDGEKMVYCNDGFYRYTGLSHEEYLNVIEQNPYAYIVPEDIPEIKAAFERFRRGDTRANCTYRCVDADGRFRWYAFTGSLYEKRGDTLIITVVRINITERKEVEEALRINEEMFRAAASIGDRVIARYDIKTGTYTHNDKRLTAMGFGETIENMPDTFINAGMIAPECLNDYRKFYEKLKRGEKNCVLDSAILMDDGTFRWHRREATVIFDAEGAPSIAVIAISDITEQRVKEALYTTWQQSLREKPADSYTFFRWNLTKDTQIDAPEGTLLRGESVPGSAKYNSRSLDYAMRYVFAEDREAYIEFTNSDSLLINYYRELRHRTIEFRELQPDGSTRWLRLTVELLKYPNSSDVCAVLMYENVDETKRRELLSKQRADTDPLTGVLNRAAFARAMDRLIHESALSQHAFLVLDVDGFKLLNDILGHAEGDQALIDIANALHTVTRHGDLIGRLGGDEFFMCLKDISYGADIEKKAREICEVVKKTFTLDVQLSISVGIAVYPKDGEDFETLYRKADTALYAVKESGKDNFGFYSDEHISGDYKYIAESPVAIQPHRYERRRILIVDDDGINCKLLAEIFKDEFMIDTASDGSSALIKMRHYGAALSAVLLDMNMPGGDGFSVLEKARNSVDMRTIPIIAICEQYEFELCLKAIQLGATDYATMPIDPPLLLMRVRAAVGKAENERARVQNSYLLMQSNDDARYHTVLKNTGTIIIEHDWLSGKFLYDEIISKYIAGKFDGRKLWLILLSDMVADVMDVKALQDLVRNIANDRTLDKGDMKVMLKTPSGKKRWFHMRAFKLMNEFNLTNKIIITFKDIHDEVTQAERLRFLAERDELTGLYNQQAFIKRAGEMARAEEANYFVIMALDIINFRRFNAVHGRDEGDELLKHVADKLAADFTREGELCARVVNDEFAALVHYNPATIDKIINYPLEMFSNYNRAFDAECRLGFYIIDNPALNAREMLDRAIIAKRAAKAGYGVKVMKYNPDMEREFE